MKKRKQKLPTQESLRDTPTLVLQHCLKVNTTWAARPKRSAKKAIEESARIHMIRAELDRRGAPHDPPE